VSRVEIERGRARVVVESTIYGGYDDSIISELRRAVADACRAVGTDAALELAADLTAEAAR